MLRECGALGSGTVTRVKAAAHERHTATVATLDVRYTIDASGFAPTRLFLKHGTRAGEPGFYSTVAPTLPQGVVPGCYFCEWDEEHNDATLLFEDLSASFDPPSRIDPPGESQVDATLRALAALHSTWWQHPRLDEIADVCSASSKAFVLQTAFECFPEFMAKHGASLSPTERSAFDRFFGSDYLAQFASRLATGPRTAIHGDAHVGQVMFARDGSPRVRLIDWEDWQAGVGSDDIAFFFVMHAYRDWSPMREVHYLAAYHAALVEGGVKNYSLDDLRADLTFSVRGLLAWPVFWAMYFGSPEKTWRPILASVVRALG